MTKKTEPEGPLWDMLNDLKEYETLKFRLWLWGEDPFKPRWKRNKTHQYRFPKTASHVHMGAHYHLRRQHERNQKTT